MQTSTTLRRSADAVQSRFRIRPQMVCTYAAVAKFRPIADDCSVTPIGGNRMPRINGGELLVRALEREGVHEVFALHGGHPHAIFTARPEHGLRGVATPQYQAAAP